MDVAILPTSHASGRGAAAHAAERAARAARHYRAAGGAEGWRRPTSRRLLFLHRAARRIACRSSVARLPTAAPSASRAPSPPGRRAAREPTPRGLRPASLTARAHPLPFFFGNLSRSSRRTRCPRWWSWRTAVVSRRLWAFVNSLSSPAYGLFRSRARPPEFVIGRRRMPPSPMGARVDARPSSPTSSPNRFNRSVSDRRAPPASLRNLWFARSRATSASKPSEAGGHLLGRSGSRSRRGRRARAAGSRCRRSRDALAALVRQRGHLYCISVPSVLNGLVGWRSDRGLPWQRLGLPGRRRRRPSRPGCLALLAQIQMLGCPGQHAGDVIAGRRNRWGCC